MRNPFQIFLLVIFFVFVGLSAVAQDRDDYEERRSELGLKYSTFRAALFPGLSTHGLGADEYASKYSLNILAGYNGAFEKGFELGGLLNLNKYYAHGLQIAGLGNYSGDETVGIQLSGVFNYAGEEMQGIQLTGGANISKDDMQGMQLTGGLNWSGGAAQGIQISSIANIAKGEMQGLFFTGAANISAGNQQGIMLSGGVNVTEKSMQGLMFSGLFNYSDTFQGIALSSVNVSKDFQGIQVGSINITERGEGIQAGLINYGEDFDGAPVGLISYYKNGRTDLDVWTSDAGFTNLGVKLGTHDIYNMISVGFNPYLDRNVWQVGWSIGRYRQFKNHFRYTDFSFFKINEGDWTEELNSLFKYRVLFGKDFGNGIQLYGGPTVNMLISRVEESNTYTWYRLFDFGAKGRDYVFWIGYSVGIELF